MKRITLVLGGMLVVGIATAASPELALEVVSPPAPVAVGDSLAIDLRVVNRSASEVAVFEPDSIHKIWPCWRLTGRVTRPDGRELALQPEVTFAAMGMPKAEHVRRLDPGQALTIPIRLVRDDPTTTHPPGGWVAVIPISDFEAEHLPEGALKAAHDVRGEVYLISGAGHHLAVRDVLRDVFDQPGRYRLWFSLETGPASMLPPENGFAPQFWTGTLTEEADVTLEAPEPPGG